MADGARDASPPAGAGASPDAGVLLTTKDVASFVANGYLRLDGVVPDALAGEALAELAAGAARGSFGAPAEAPEARWPGQPLDTIWPASSALGRLVRLPRVAGAIHSLLGAHARYDHHYAHVIAANQQWSQPWHADAIVDPRPHAFDIQLLFFLHDTPREMGGTMILPGSHFRRVNESDVARYQNFVGQLATVCQAGTLLVCHHGIWHCGQPNRTARPRTMLKLRLGPAGRQTATWDTRDLDDPAIASTLRVQHPWTGSSDGRLEIVSRIRLWRYLTGDGRFDIDYWLGRLEGGLDGA